MMQNDTADILNAEKEESGHVSPPLTEDRETAIREVKKAQRGLVFFLGAFLLMSIIGDINLIVFTVCSLLMALFLHSKVKKTGWGVHQSPPLSSVGYTMLLLSLELLVFTALIACLMSALVSWLGTEESVRFLTEVSKMDTTSSWYDDLSFLALVNLTILMPLCEELLFRGYLLQAYRRVGDTFAIFMSALLFAALHDPLLQSIFTFLGGLSYAILAVRYNSILPAILCHMLNNTVAAMLLKAASGGQESIWTSDALLAGEISAAQPWLLWGSAFLFIGALYLFFRVCKYLHRQTEKGTRFVLTSSEARGIILHWPVVLITVLFVFAFLYNGLLWVRLFMGFM